MPNNDQAEADATDQTTALDPMDTKDTHNIGTSDLSAYEAEIARLSLEEDPVELPEEPIDTEEAFEEESDEATGEEANEEIPEEDDQEEPEQSTSNRFRIRAKDEVEAEALALRKRHPDLSLKDCIAKAEMILGVQVEPEKSVEAETQGETVESVNSQIEELRKLRKEATSEMEFDTVSELTDKIDDLRDKRDELKVFESQVKAEFESKEQKSFDAEYAKSERLTVTYYPETTNAQSPMVKRMVEIDAQMRDLGDPLYHSPDKPFLLAKAAARDLGVIMTKPDTAAKVSRSSKSPIQPVAGNRGTTSTNTAKRAEEVISGIKTSDDYERIVASMG